jgi:hypothetical protein
MGPTFFRVSFVNRVKTKNLFEVRENFEFK